MKVFNLIDKLFETQNLSIKEYELILINTELKHIEYAAKKANEVRKLYYQNKVYIRGLIEISNRCKNNCFYCGIRKDNKNIQRYYLQPEEIFECCKKGYSLGFRTFVLQGAEDFFYTDEVLCTLIKEIKKDFLDCAITLSLGERSLKSYNDLKNAGADRYLLRFETSKKEHYQILHPKQMSFENRIKCLENLRECGFQVGTGFMIGSPFQTIENIANDLFFIQNFRPEMCGIGPFIPHKDTKFNNFKAGTLNQTLLCLSLIRLACPKILLPATTALATIDTNGILLGIKAGANVIMPNLSPSFAIINYSLYNDKLRNKNQDAEKIEVLKQEIKSINYEIVLDKGDALK